MAYHACVQRYDACHDAFETLMAMTAGELLARLVAAMEGLQRGWSDHKRAAALLDFDDLLCTAHDLLYGCTASLRGRTPIKCGYTAAPAT